MIDFKGFYIPLISLGFFRRPQRFYHIRCAMSSNFRLCCLCLCCLCFRLCGAYAERSSSAPRANTQRPAYVLAPGCTCVGTPSIRSVRGGNGAAPSMALRVPAPGISGPNLPASVLDKRWQLCYNIPWQIGWHLGWQIGRHLVRQSACRISSAYFRHSTHSDIHA